MHALTPFTHPSTGQTLRVIGDPAAPLIHLGDACAILRHTNPSVARRMLAEDEAVQVNMRDISAGETALNFSTPATGNTRAWFVTEPGFYVLALRSNAPGARDMRRWVTHDVLPTLRSTGRYDVGERLSGVELARHWLAAEERAEAATARAVAAEEHAAGLAPSAAAWNDLAAADTGDYSLRDAAQTLTRAGIITGQNRLLAYLREAGWVGGRDDQPYQRFVNRGYITRRAIGHTTAYGKSAASWQLRITPAGLRKLHQDLTAERLPALPAHRG